MLYRGIAIVKVEATQVNYPTNRSTKSKVGIGTKRKITGWSFTVEGYERIADTLAEAKSRVDSLLGEETAP